MPNVSHRFSPIRVVRVSECVCHRVAEYRCRFFEADLVLLQICDSFDRVGFKFHGLLWHAIRTLSVSVACIERSSRSPGTLCNTTEHLGFQPLAEKVWSRRHGYMGENGQNGRRNRCCFLVAAAVPVNRIPLPALSRHTRPSALYFSKVI